MAPAPLCRTEELGDAETFMARLEPDPRLWPLDPRDWLFRGHADDRWPLVPASLRDEVVLSVNPADRRRGPRPTHGEQTRAEHDLLRRFFRALDERGLAIPEDTQRHRSASGLHAWAGEVVAAAVRGEAAWPPVELWSQMALAQHYGIPTRLLDWAMSAAVAGYFAAKRAAEWLAGDVPLSLGATHLAVWGFNARALAALEAHGRGSGVAVVTAPGAVIPNLVGQRGLFTVHQSRAAADTPLAVRTHDDVVLSALAGHDAGWLREQGVVGPVFVRLRLPHGEAPRLLRLLAYHGIDASLLFAGHQGAAEAVLEEAYWDELPDPGTGAPVTYRR